MSSLETVMDSNTHLEDSAGARKPRGLGMQTPTSLTMCCHGFFTAQTSGPSSDELLDSFCFLVIALKNKV